MCMPFEKLPKQWGYTIADTESKDHLLCILCFSNPSKVLDLVALHLPFGQAHSSSSAQEEDAFVVRQACMCITFENLLQQWG